ncbi:MAG: hypothetical protein KDD55_00845 [Bdellovibrionales bacterium]|nr:hypothetical protein [Bdellovibrionales bacterium]
MVAISQYIDSNYVKRLAGLSRGEKRGGQALTTALKGGSSESKIQASFRFGAQAYTKSLSGINFAASLVNFAHSDLTQMQSLTNEMIELAEEAAKPVTSTQRRLRLNQAFGDLGREFRDIERGAEVGETKYLTKTGLQETFATIGLDYQESPDVKKMLERFVTVDEEHSLASREIKGEDTKLPPGSGLPKPLHYTTELFNLQRNITRQADAQAILDDLYALSGQISTNLEALNGATDLLYEHALLVRSTAVSMVDILEQIDKDVDATEAAKMLRKAIAKAPRQALAHAANLEPLVVASLTLDEAGIVTEPTQ